LSMKNTKWRSGQTVNWGSRSESTRETFEEWLLSLRIVYQNRLNICFLSILDVHVPQAHQSNWDMYIDIFADEVKLVRLDQTEVCSKTPNHCNTE
jgi:hypothetical protein